MLLTIEKLIYGGDGLARLPADSRGPGKAVFVPFVLAGEKIEAALTEEKSGFARAHAEGGFLAMPQAPMPDLLSTATTLHALACLERELPAPLRERSLDFIDTLWNAEGGFHGHWADDDLDADAVGTVGDA